MVMQQASRSPGTTDHYNVSSLVAKRVSSLHTASQHPMHTPTSQHPMHTAASQHPMHTPTQYPMHTPTQYPMCLLVSHCCITLTLYAAPAAFTLTSYV